MSTSIHATIEYRQHGMTWGFASPRMSVSMSNVFGLLGAKGHNYVRTIVPQRGWPKSAEAHDAMSSEWRRQAAALVVKGKAKDEYEVDGHVITEATAEEWLSSKWGHSQWLEDEWHGEYRYISNPDIHSVNWITADELEKVVKRLEKDLQRPDGREGGFITCYKATLAAMRALEFDDRVSDVRLVYGFDN